MSIITQIQVGGTTYDVGGGGSNSTIIGKYNYTSGDDTIAIGVSGHEYVSSSDKTVLIGWDNYNYGNRAITLGDSNLANAYGTAIGYHNTAARYAFVTGAYASCNKPGVVANQHYTASGVDDLYYQDPKSYACGQYSHAGFIGLETSAYNPFFKAELSDTLVATLQVIDLSNGNTSTIMFTVRNSTITSQQVVHGSTSLSVAISNGGLYISGASGAIQLAMWYNLASYTSGGSSTGSGGGSSWSSGSSSGLYT